jgi:hypothetical protein
MLFFMLNANCFNSKFRIPHSEIESGTGPKPDATRERGLTLWGMSNASNLASLTPNIGRRRSPNLH